MRVANQTIKPGLLRTEKLWGNTIEFYEDWDDIRVEINWMAVQWLRQLSSDFEEIINSYLKGIEATLFFIEIPKWE